MKNILLSFAVLSLQFCHSRQESVTSAHNTINLLKEDSTWQNSSWQHLRKQQSFYDFERIIQLNEKNYLDSIINGFNKASKFKLVVVTINSIDFKDIDFDTFVESLAAALPIQKRRIDPLILFAVSAGGKRITIYTDANARNWLSGSEIVRILRDWVEPSFVSGRYFEGILQGVQEIMNGVESKADIGD